MCARGSSQCNAVPARMPCRKARPSYAIFAFKLRFCCTAAAPGIAQSRAHDAAAPCCVAQLQALRWCRRVSAVEQSRKIAACKHPRVVRVTCRLESIEVPSHVSIVRVQRSHQYPAPQGASSLQWGGLNKLLADPPSQAQPRSAAHPQAASGAASTPAGRGAPAAAPAHAVDASAVPAQDAAPWPAPHAFHTGPAAAHQAAAERAPASAAATAAAPATLLHGMRGARAATSSADRNKVSRFQTLTSVCTADRTLVPLCTLRRSIVFIL